MNGFPVISSELGMFFSHDKWNLINSKGAEIGCSGFIGPLRICMLYLVPLAGKLYREPSYWSGNENLNLNLKKSGNLPVDRPCPLSTSEHAASSP